MTSSAQWTARAVFVSSTFRDMQAERDWLHEHVRLTLEERLRERRCHLEFIDLRWGVDTRDHAEEGRKESLVLKVCLESIDRCRPYLVVLLGDRYGWVPPAERLQHALDQASRAEGLANMAPREPSVTELEIRYGVLGHHDPVPRAHFFLREPLPYEEMATSTAAAYSDLHATDAGAWDRHERLKDLKRRIRAEVSPERVHSYSVSWDSTAERVSDLEAFGKLVCDSLWSDLAAEILPFVDQGQSDWIDEEEELLEQVVERCSRDFVGRETVCSRLREFALGPSGREQPWCASVTAEPGAGKTAVVSHLYRELSKDGVVVLAHSAGISPRSTTVSDILRRWSIKLQRVVGGNAPIVDHTESTEVDARFARLLSGAASKRRVILLLDALDQLEGTPRARCLTWLPELWPENARLITTAIGNSDASVALEKRAGVFAIELQPLELIDAETIVRRVCQRHHRRIHPEVLKELTEKRCDDGRRACGSALWVTIAAEELNLLDQDDFERAERELSGSGEEKLHQLLVDTASDMPADIEGLYAWLLDRVGKVWGERWTQGFVEFVTLSRGGWRDRDFQELLPVVSGQAWDPLALAGLRRSLRAHVVRRGPDGKWGFFHSQMRLAALRGSLGSSGLAPILHGAIAQHLKDLPPDDSVRQSELMYHLFAANDQEQAAEWLGGVASSEKERASAGRYLADRIGTEVLEQTEETLQWVVSLLEFGGEPDCVGRLCHFLLFDVYNSLSHRARLSSTLHLAEAVITNLERLVERDPSHDDWQRDLSVALSLLGQAKRARGDMAGASRVLSQVVERHRLAQVRDPESEDARHLTALALCELGVTTIVMGDFVAAREHLVEGHQLLKLLTDADEEQYVYQHDFSLLKAALGDLAVASGDFEEAERYWLACVEIRRRNVEWAPFDSEWCHDLGTALTRLGTIVADQGRVGEARSYLGEAKQVLQRMTREEPWNELWQSDLDRVVAVFRLLDDMRTDGKGAMLNPAASRAPGAVEPAAAVVAQRMACAFVAGGWIGIGVLVYWLISWALKYM